MGGGEPVVVPVEPVVEDGEVVAPGLALPGAVVELLTDGVAAVSLPAVVEGVVAVVEALALAPVAAPADPDHQSLEARLLGEAFR